MILGGYLSDKAYRRFVTRRPSDHTSLAAADGLMALAIAVFIVAPAGTYSYHFRHFLDLRIRMVDAAFGVAFVLGWQYCFSVLNLYDKFATIPSRMSAILKGVVLMTIPLILHLRFFHRQLLTGSAIVLLIAFLFCYEMNRLTISVYLLDRLAARDPRRAIILGSGRRASKAWREIRTRYHSSIAMLGFVDNRDVDEMPPDVATRYLGTVDQLSDILLNKVVDTILIAMPIQSCYPLMQEAVHIAESVGVHIIYLQDIYSTRRQYEDPNENIFAELVPRQEHYLMRLAIKRIVDIIGASLGLILLSPLLVLIAIGVKLTSPGPILFFQNRFGHRRRIFRIIKFRSMVEDAEKQLSGLESANDARGPIFKMREDPRITKFGKILRRTSLDELPQLWNVLSGEMSLVGPRPMSIRDVSLFSTAALMRRFSVKPGITGLLQVNGRSSVGFEDWVTMDSSYIDGWSLLLDFKILVRTVTTVIKRSGAM